MMAHKRSYKMNGKYIVAGAYQLSLPQSSELQIEIKFNLQTVVLLDWRQLVFPDPNRVLTYLYITPQVVFH